MLTAQCDKKVPSCSQCLKAGLECGGYGRATVWVNATQDPSTSQVAYAKPRARASSSSGSSDDSGHEILLHDSLVRSARERKYLGLYWSEFLFHGRPFSRRAWQFTTAGWTSMLQDLYDTEPALRFAILALSVSMLGGLNKDEQLRLKGLQTYDRGVTEMRTGIQHVQRARSDGLMAAVRLLQFYEMLYGKGEPGGEGVGGTSQIAGWTVHGQGELAMYLARGPRDLATGPGHQIYIDGRLNSIVASISTRKRSPLASEDWKTLPFLYTEKRLIDKLMDVLVAVPGFIEDLRFLRTIQSQGRETRHLRRVLLSNCQNSIDELAAWRREAAPLLETFDYTARGLPLPVPKSDEELGILHMSCSYWVTCVFLATIYGYALEGWDEADKETRANMEDMDPTLSCYRIARCIHLFFQPNFGAYAIKTAVFPLGVAVQYLMIAESAGRPSEERKLLVQMIKKPFLGTIVGGFLSNLQKEATDLREERRAGVQYWWSTR